MLFGESGIDPTVADERGYYTARSRSGAPEILKGYQRKPGLVVPTFSPDGITQSCQLRPDRPRKDKKGEPLKYETPGGSRSILDVHPRMLEAVRDGAGDLWVTEGIKKADCLTSRGLPTIGLVGVWNWQRDKEMLPCWDHVRLKGRRVYVVFDADVMTKESVQMALERLVTALEARGADVMVTYLPGPEKGVDDYLVGGHAVPELKMLSRRFEPADLGRIRLSRDEKLRAAVGDLERRFWDAEWKGTGGHSARDVAVKLIEAARKHGKMHPDGLRVVKAQGPLAIESKVSSRTLWKSLNRLEEMGFGYRDNKDREDGKSGAFVLRANVSHMEESPDPVGKATESLQGFNPNDLHLRAPRLMWSRPAFTPKRGTVAGTRKVRESKAGEPRSAIHRLGKIRGAILDVLDSAGGTATVQEIADALHRKRARDLRRRNLPWLEEAGILTVADDVVTLADNWLDRLEGAREAGGELEAEELARKRHRDRSRAFHGRDRVGPDRHHANAGADGHVEDLKPADPVEREPEGPEPKVDPNVAAVLGYVNRMGRIRLGLLEEVWLDDHGGDLAALRRAVEDSGVRTERLTEHRGAVFLYPPAPTAA